jgi:hypothetical protein
MPHESLALILAAIFVVLKILSTKPLSSKFIQALMRYSGPRSPLDRAFDCG